VAYERRTGMRILELIRSRQLLVGAVTAGLLAVAGGTCIALAATHQGHAPGNGVGAGATTSVAEPAANLSTSLVMSRSLPVSVSIPSIGVRSALLSLGQEADGSIQVAAPGPNYGTAGWYRYSPTPGSLGPAVIVGHVDSAADGPSVFFRLGSVQPHATVLVTRADGSVAVFQVDSVQEYPKAAFPTKIVYGNTNVAALRLITCGGSFDASIGHYRDNIVVFATLVRAA